MKSKVLDNYIHSSFFGIEDSLVSTTGVLAGIAVGTPDKAAIFLSAIVIITVESIASGASEFLSTEIEDEEHLIRSKASPLLSALIIFVSYAAAGFIPLLPYLFLPHKQAIPISIVCTLLALAALGVYKGKITHKSAARSSLEILIIGGLSTGIGIIAGLVFHV